MLELIVGLLISVFAGGVDGNDCRLEKSLKDPSEISAGCGCGAGQSNQRDVDGHGQDQGGM
jgi:hypothetical protein